MVVNSHFEFRLVVRKPGVSYGDYAVLPAGCQKSFTVGIGSLTGLPLQDRDSTIVGGCIVGTGKPFASSIPNLAVIVSSAEIRD